VQVLSRAPILESEAGGVLHAVEITAEALAHLVGWSATLEGLAQRMRCSQCGKKAAEVIAVADQGVVPKLGSHA